MEYSSEEQHLNAVYDEWMKSDNVEAIIIYDGKEKHLSFGDVFIVVIDREIEMEEVRYLEFDGERATVSFMNKDEMNKYLYLKTESDPFYCLIKGDIIFERKDLISKSREKIEDYLYTNKEKALGVTFSMVVMNYKNAKDLFHLNNYLDSYSKLFKTIEGLAEFVMIKQGDAFEGFNISELKQIDLEVYKLYEELVTNEESIEKRLELILLAVGYIVAKELKLGAKHLFDVIEEKETWKFNELFHHPGLIDYGLSLGFLLDYLSEKNAVDTNYLQDGITQNEIVYKKTKKDD